MRTTVITINPFDPSSVDKAVRELRQYSERVKRKADELRNKVAELIQERAEPVFQAAIADDTFKVVVKGGDDREEGPKIGGVTVTVEPTGENVTLVIAHGKDAVFMEFGAGVYSNGSVGSSPNPWGNDLGFTIGSYGLGNGKKTVWGFKGEDGQIHLTHGTPASMPLYRAVQSVSRDIVKIAREVFAND